MLSRLGTGELALRRVGRVGLAIAAAVVVVAVLIQVLGASPTSGLSALVHGSVGTAFSLGETIMLASILALTGLAAAVPFTARAFNAGAEGQLYIGALAGLAVAFSLSPHTPQWLLVTLVVLAGALAGGLWGAIPGVMKAFADVNEVIVSLMLTFVAALAALYATTDLWPSGLGSETKNLPQHALLPTISHSMSVTLGAPLAVVTILVAWLLMSRGTLGFQIRATGANREAAEMNGIPVRRVEVLAFTIGGAAAGMSGVILVAGIYGSLISNVASGYGFLGIAVALVARLAPLWLIPSAFLFAALQIGSNQLQVQAGISPAFGSVLVGVLVVSLLVFGAIRLRYAEVG